MKREPVKLGTGCLILFALPFAGVGVFMLVRAVQLLMSGAQPWEQIVFSVIFAIVFGGVGFGLMIGVIVGGKKLQRIKVLKENNPDKPWLWKEEWASGRIKSSTKLELILSSVFALFWSLISFPVSIVAIQKEFFEKGNKAVLFVLLFPLIGIFLLIWAVRKFLEWKKYGTSLFEMASVPGVIGGLLGGVIRVNKKLIAEDGFHLKLSCINRVTTGSGKSSSTTEHILWENEQTVVADLMAADPSGSAIPVAFQIPYECRETDNRNSHNVILWRLEVRAKVPGTDYHAKFEVPVFKTEASSKEMPTGVDPGQAYRAKEEPYEPSSDSKILVRPGGLNGEEYYFSAARNPGAALFSVLFFIGWTGAIVAMVYFKAPTFLTIIFGFFDLLIFLGILQFLSGTTSVLVEPGTITIAKRLLGAGRTKTILSSDVKDVKIAVGMQMGSTPYYDIKMVCADGKELVVGNAVKNRKEADWLATRMKKFIFDHPAKSNT